MRKSKFNEPLKILIFNEAKILVGVFHSTRSAAKFSGGNSQSMSHACTGRYISSGGYYFRHIDTNIEIDQSDIGTLELVFYDEQLCGKTRLYHKKNKMKKYKTKTNLQNKNISEE